MGEAIIQVEYSKLEMMAKQFGRHSEAVAQVKQLCERQVCRVQDGGWTGQAANAIIHEMDNRCLPAVRRLVLALEQAQEVTLETVRFMREAEEKAAQPFRTGAIDPPSSDTKLTRKQERDFQRQLKDIDPDIIEFIQENAETINRVAKQQGIDPRVLAAVIVYEQNFNVEPGENWVDSAAALSGLSDEASLGPAQIKIKRAKFLAEQGYLGEAAKSYNHHQIVALLLHPETNIKIAGAELKFLRDYWNEHGYDFMAKIQNGQEKDALGVWTLAYNQGPGHHFGEGPDAHSSPSYIDGKMGEWTANNYDLIDYMLKR